jgi:hypothetical protein
MKHNLTTACTLNHHSPHCLPGKQECAVPTGHGACAPVFYFLPNFLKGLFSIDSCPGTGAMRSENNAHNIVLRIEEI